MKDEKKIWKKQLISWLTIIIIVVVFLLTAHFAVVWVQLDDNIQRYIASIFVFASFIVIGIILGAIVHELGHLVLGLLTGYSFSRLNILNFNWYKEDGRIRFYTAACPIGQCLMCPPENEKHFKFILYNLGGNIAVLFFCIVLLVLIIILDSSVLALCLFAVLFVNIIMLFINLLPIKSWTSPTDVANILEILKSREAVQAFYKMLYINHQVVEGRRYKDFPLEEMQVAESADLCNYHVATLVLMEAEYWDDVGDHAKAFATWRRLDDIELPNSLRYILNTNLLFYYCCEARDIEKAKEIYAQDGVEKMLNIEMPQFMMIKAAYEFYVLNNKKKGDEILVKALTHACNIPIKGEKLMILGHLERLKTRMNDAKV